jgi:hypothetical protein
MTSPLPAPAFNCQDALAVEAYVLPGISQSGSPAPLLCHETVSSDHASPNAYSPSVVAFAPASCTVSRRLAERTCTMPTCSKSKRRQLLCSPPGARVPATVSPRSTASLLAATVPSAAGRKASVCLVAPTVCGGGGEGGAVAIGINVDWQRGWKEKGRC